MAELQTIASEQWRKIRRKYGNPNLPEPIVGDDGFKGTSVHTSFINLEDKQTHISESFVKMLQELGVEPEDSIEAIEEHEINHHVFCPWDLATHLRFYKEVKPITEDQKKTWHAVNLFEDVVLNTNVVGTGQSKLPILYRAMPKEGVDRVVAGLYERTWKHEMNVGKLSRDEAEAADRLAELPYLARAEWNATAPQFASLVLPFLKQPPGSGGACGHGGLDGYTEEDKIKAMKQLIKEMPKGEFQELMEDFEGEMEKAVERYVGKDKGGIVPREAKKGDLLYYMLTADNHSIYINKKPVKKSGNLFPNETREWEAGEPVAEINPFASFGKIGIPGITKKWVHTDIAGSHEGQDVPDLTLLVDSSGSMVDPSEELSYAVLGAGVAADSYLRKGRDVAVYNFGHAQMGQELVVPFTRDRKAIYSGLVHYFDAPDTTIDTAKVRKLAEGRDKPDVILISDMQITNAGDVIKYISEGSNRFTMVHIGGTQQTAQNLRKAVDSKKATVYPVTRVEDIPKIIVGKVAGDVYQR
jgi:vacuolar-type H+-ATPase subunit F/Vma7